MTISQKYRALIVLFAVLLSAPMAVPMALAVEAWPEFRGPGGQGHAGDSDVPLQWSEAKNVTWKTAIHGQGWSTPVVWGKQVWLTTASEDGRKMYAICLDRETGEIIYDKLLFENESVEPLGNNVNRYASPSPTIEEGRVYIHFGSYGTACLSTQTGEVLWQRRDLPCRHYRGPASSTILYKDKLILTMDGVDYQYLIALDKTTGREIWKTDRTTDFQDLGADGKPVAEGDYRKAYTTPLIITRDGKDVMISTGARATFAYDPNDGSEIWRVTYKGFSNAAMPLVDGDTVYINTGFGRPDLQGFRLDGKGDITLTHHLWTYSKNVPKKPSEILVDGLIYFVDDSGVATCVDAASGEEIWKERIGGNFSASPIYVAGHILFCDETGKTTVIKPGRTLQVIGENELDAGHMASPAVAGDSLFLRTRTHMYRLDKK